MSKPRRRAAIRRRLVEIATASLTDVVLVDADPDVEGDEGRTETIPVTYIAPGENTTTSCFFMGPTVTGRTDPASVDRKPIQQDKFTIEGRIVVPKFDITAAVDEEYDTDEEREAALLLARARVGADAEEAAERVFIAFEEGLRSTQRLVSADIESAMTPSAFDVSIITIGDVTGPYCGLESANAASLSGGITFTLDVLYTLT